jgi:hypothetical protein
MGASRERVAQCTTIMARAIFNQTHILERPPRASIRINRVASKTIRVGQATKKHAMQALTNSNSDVWVSRVNQLDGTTFVCSDSVKRAIRVESNVAGWMLFTSCPNAMLVLAAVVSLAAAQSPRPAAVASPELTCKFYQL